MARLDPEKRALLELACRRRMSDQEIAGLLRLEPAAIAERRRQAEQRLGRELGVPEESPEQLRARLESAPWPNGRGDRGSGAARRRSRRTLGFGVLGLAIAALAVVLIVLDDGGGGSEDRALPARPSPAQPTASRGPVRTMQRLNDTHGHGTAQLLRSGGRARLRLRLTDFLTPNGGGYAVWLFNSRDDARRLYATVDTAVERDLPLPSGYGRYEFVDVARAVPELASPHSGLSLLRVRLAELR
jgi:hypothetical protein